MHYHPPPNNNNQEQPPFIIVHVHVVRFNRFTHSHSPRARTHILNVCSTNPMGIGSERCDPIKYPIRAWLNAFSIDRCDRCSKRRECAITPRARAHRKTSKYHKDYAYAHAQFRDRIVSRLILLSFASHSLYCAVARCANLLYMLMWRRGWGGAFEEGGFANRGRRLSSRAAK